MTLPSLHHPTSEAVAVAWLSTWFPVGVATSLPKPGTWSTLSGSIQGFATVSIVGGRIAGGFGRMPVVSLGTWAAVPGSDNPQWGAASQLAEKIVRLAQTPTFDPVFVRQRAGYERALVHSISLVSEPRRIPDPDASAAHFETEFVLVWTAEPD
jgi:hypothetical protein